MNPINLLDARDRDELRRWLEKNHAKEKECWITVKRGKPSEDGSFPYIDAVEEALCFGWIDSTVKKLSNTVTAQRLTPRKKGSKWTELNKERCRRMEQAGRMTEAGRAALAEASAAFVIDDDVQEALRAVPEAWRNFQTFPELYRRVRVDNVQRTRKNPELFRSRLQKLVESSAQGIMYGQWDDYGRSAAARREETSGSQEDDDARQAARPGGGKRRHENDGCTTNHKQIKEQT